MATAAEEEVERQITAYQRASAAVRAAVLTFVARAWNGLEQYRDGDIDRWVATVTPVVSAGLMQTGALTDAYLANVIGAQTGTPPAPRGVRPEDVSVEALRGVPAGDVYRRAGQTVWAELAREAPLAAAAARGLDRAVRLAETDLQLARTHTARRVLSADSRVVGFQRSPRGSACTLCTARPGLIHGSDDLMPIHVRCQCGIVPVVDRRRLSRIRNPESEPLPVAVREHGEIGPVLTVAEHAFTGAGDI